MDVASALLKRLFVAQALGVAWADVRFGRRGDAKHGKPCALLRDGRPAPVDFNVSHQAGLVALVGCAAAAVGVGVDVVCVNERDDYRVIDQAGFEGWVDMYDDVFSPAESWDIKYTVDAFKLLDGTVVTPDVLGRHDRCCLRHEELAITVPSGEQRKVSSDLVVDAKLRRFYAFWCYKEAYIKLTGEALMAKWIKDLEFQNVRAPTPGTAPRCSVHGVWGERVSDVDICLNQERVDDVRMEIQAFEEHYMIAYAAKPSGLFPTESGTTFDLLHLGHDVFEAARAT